MLARWGFSGRADWSSHYHRHTALHTYLPAFWKYQNYGNYFKIDILTSINMYQIIYLKFVEIEYTIAPSPSSFLKIWNLKSSKWNLKPWPKVSVPLDLLKKKNTVAVVDRKWNVLGKGNLKVVYFLLFPNEKLESNDSVLFLASQSQPILVPVFTITNVDPEKSYLSGSAVLVWVTSWIVRVWKTIYH